LKQQLGKTKDDKTDTLEKPKCFFKTKKKIKKVPFLEEYLLDLNKSSVKTKKLVKNKELNCNDGIGQNEKINI
jgi:hypothetical protein